MKVLTSTQVDPQKWDSAIANINGRNPLYAYLWYLNCTCGKNWYALIFNDYESVVPIPSQWKLKYWKSSLRPPYTQQLGVFGKALNQEQDTHLIAHIESKHQTIDYPISKLPSSTTKLKLRPRVNMEVDLNSDYESIYSKYSKSLKKRLKHASNHLIIKQSEDVAKHIQFYKSSLKGKVKFSQEEIKCLEAIIKNAFHHGKGLILEAWTVDSEEKIASAFFVTDKVYLTNLAGGSNVAGREHFAMHALINELIKSYAGQKKILDMEGSDLPGIQSFFSSFGAVKKTYYHLQKSIPLLEKIWSYKI